MNNRHISRTTIAALAFVALMVTAPMAMAAAPSLDTESTNTTTTSDVAAGDALLDFNASASEHTYIEYTADSSNSKVAIKDPSTGETYYSNASVMTTDSTNGHYAVNVSHDKLSRVPVEANSNTTVEVVITNNTEVSSPDTHAFNLTLAADGSRSVIDLNDHVSADEDVFESETVGLLGIEMLSDYVGEHTTSDLSQDNVAIDGENTTVTVHLTNSTAQDSFATATDGTEAGMLDIDVQTTMSAGSDDTSVPIFVDEAADEMPDGQTYGVYDSNSNKITYHLGDSFDGKSEIDSLTVKSGHSWGWGSVLTFSQDFGLGLISQKANPGLSPLF